MNIVTVDYAAEGISIVLLANGMPTHATRTAVLAWLKQKWTDVDASAWRWDRRDDGEFGFTVSNTDTTYIF